MAASVSKSAILSVLLCKSLSEIEEIQQQAEQVVFGFITSIAALSQSTTYDPDNAAVVMEACVEARAILEGGGGPADAAPATFGHGMRFQPVCNPPGMTWGC